MSEEYAPEFISLLDEEGNEHQFEILDQMELDGENYMAVVPCYDDPAKSLEDTDEMVILKYVDDGDEEYLEPIEDEEEFNRVSAVFVERLEDDYEFVDE